LAATAARQSLYFFDVLQRPRYASISFCHPLLLCSKAPSDEKQKPLLHAKQGEGLKAFSKEK
jgi:hypothetical protein